ncbi:MAG: hypothetical protein PHC64_02405 [Candidatus Gastranaerophilales bacterium]|nr:hypothetical protein [Candidatus Gastranaerophilales bacterium]
MQVQRLNHFMLSNVYIKDNRTGLNLGTPVKTDNQVSNPLWNYEQSISFGSFATAVDVNLYKFKEIFDGVCQSNNGLISSYFMLGSFCDYAENALQVALRSDNPDIIKRVFVLLGQLTQEDRIKIVADPGAIPQQPSLHLALTHKNPEVAKEYLQNFAQLSKEVQLRAVHVMDSQGRVLPEVLKQCEPEVVLAYLNLTKGLGLSKKERKTLRKMAILKTHPRPPKAHRPPRPSKARLPKNTQRLRSLLRQEKLGLAQEDVDRILSSVDTDAEIVIKSGLIETFSKLAQETNQDFSSLVNIIAAVKNQLQAKFVEDLVSLRFNTDALIKKQSIDALEDTLADLRCDVIIYPELVNNGQVTSEAARTAQGVKTTVKEAVDYPNLTLQAILDVIPDIKTYQDLTSQFFRLIERETTPQYS